MGKNQWQCWLKRFFATNFLVIVLFIGSSLTISHLFREDYSKTDILADYSNILYGSVVKEFPMIKFDIVALKHPNVVAIGSSRVMQFRDDYFLNQSFYTMGGTGNSLDEAQETFERLKALHLPKVIILGIDLWWLNPRFWHGNNLQHNEALQENQYIGYFQIWTHLVRDGKIRQQLFNLDKLREIDEYGKRKTVGLAAAAKGDGFRLSDGSYQYGDIMRKNPSTEEKFQDTYSRLQEGNRRFEWADTLDEQELMKFRKILREIKDSGSHLIVFLPPFPHEIYASMDTNEHYYQFLHSFEDTMRQECLEADIVFFDFSDMAWLDADDSETIDGFHGSDLAYARIVQKMLVDYVLCQYVDSQRLELMIQNPVNDLHIVP